MESVEELATGASTSDVPLSRRRATSEGRAAAEQPTLPFAPLPFDDESDWPVAYTLTARARRTVVPASVPSLAVLEGGHEPDDPGDTRPARARALRRAGFHAADIAVQLSVDELLVCAWVSGICPKVARARSTTARGRRQALGTDAASSDNANQTKHRELVSIRRDAQAAAQKGLLDNPHFAVGLGLLAGLVEFHKFTAFLVVRKLSVATRLMDWLTEFAPDTLHRRRLVLRIGREVSGDVVRYNWALELAVDAATISLARWNHAPEPDAVELMVHLGDPAAIARLTGWCDALMVEPVDVPVDAVH